MVRRIAVVFERSLFQNVQVFFAVKVEERVFEDDPSIWSVNLAPDKSARDTEVCSIEAEAFRTTIGVGPGKAESFESNDQIH